MSTSRLGISATRPVGRVAMMVSALVVASTSMVLLDERTAFAADIFVSTTADTELDDSECSLREAVANANDGNVHDDCVGGADGAADTIVLTVEGTYDLDSGLASTEELFIDGGTSGAGEDGTLYNIQTDVAGVRLLDQSGGDLHLTDVTFTGGDAPAGQSGGAVLATAAVNLTDAHFTDNSADDGGGAIRAQGLVDAEVSTFGGNDGGTGNGGAVNAQGAVALREVSFTDNTVGYPGSGGAVFSATSVTVNSNQTPSTFSENESGGGGGAIRSLGPVVVNDGATFTNNATVPDASQTGDGGAISADAAVELDGGVQFSGNDAAVPGANGAGGCVWAHTITVGAGSSFTDNSAQGFGGCLAAIGNVGDPVVTVNGSFPDTVTFTGNESVAAGGGAIGAYSGNGIVTLTDTVFGGPAPADANTAVSQGGAVYVANAHTLSITGSTFHGNQVLDPEGDNFQIGGGAVSFSGQTLGVSSSTFVGNSVAGTAEGGALQLDNGGATSSIVNSTFSGNATASAANGNAAAINVQGTDALNLLYVTVADSLGPAPAVRMGGSGALTFRGTVVTDTASGDNCLGAILDGPGNAGGFNAEDVDTGCPGIDALPHLGPLADNGGQTLTHRPQPKSPLIDGVDNPGCADLAVAVDQRGEIRPEDGGTACDIGAVEVQLGTLSGTVTDLPAPRGTAAPYPVDQVSVISCPAFDPTCPPDDVNSVDVNGAFGPLTYYGGDHALRAAYCEVPTCDLATEAVFGPPAVVTVPEGGVTDPGAVLQIGFRSDVQAKRSRNTSYTDQDNYPGKPNVIALIRKNETTAFNVRLQNDGNLTEEINVKGALSGSNKFTVKFKDGNTVLPGMTTAGQDFELAPGQIKNLRVTIKANANSTKGAKRTVTLTASSTGQSPVVKAPDQVGVRATRK